MKKFVTILILLLTYVIVSVSSFSMYAAPGAGQGRPAGDYLELPASAWMPANAVVTTRAVLDGKTMRSFTYRYDRAARIALWVAYPLNRALIGMGSRGEEWSPDPALPLSDQPALYRGFRPGDRPFDRGHQIPSADRLNPEANAQTFRFTNATPQLHDFNGGIWAELEKRVRRWCYQSDTLYVVTGCIPGNETISDNNGAPVNIPKAYYKAVLRLHHWKNGALHYQACAVYIPHAEGYPEIGMDFRQWAISIDDLERITGEGYFPGLGEIVGEASFRAIKSADPVKDSWWWQ